MILLSRILSVITPALTFVGLEVLVRRPEDWLYLAASLVALHLLTMMRMMRWNVREWDTWVFVALPILLLLTTEAWMLVLQTPLFVNGVAALASLMILLFYDHVFDYLYQRTEYQSYSLEHIGRYMMLGTLFAGLSGNFASILFLPLDRWVVMTSGVVFLVVLNSMAVWFLKLEQRLSRWLLLMLTCVTVEVYWVLQLLPLHFYVNALLVTTAFYAVLNLGHYAAKQSLHRDVVKRYIIGILVLLVLVLGTSEWL